MQFANVPIKLIHTAYMYSFAHTHTWTAAHNTHTTDKEEHYSHCSCIDCVRIPTYDGMLQLLTVLCNVHSKPKQAVNTHYTACSTMQQT